MLEEPRELLARALLPLNPPEPPLKPLLFDPLLFGMSLDPTWSPPRLPPPAPPAERSFALGR
ncbi:MAG TPA: hypothetical protein VEI06_14585 [Gemmatimonadaceae bacterium]|nr:hypothetical protein [Gemmatimonadaceae bacterium]